MTEATEARASSFHVLCDLRFRVADHGRLCPYYDELLAFNDIWSNSKIKANGNGAEPAVCHAERCADIHPFSQGC